MTMLHLYDTLSPRTAVALETEAMGSAFAAAMDDDLHTGPAIQVLRDVADRILTAAHERHNVEQAQQVLRACGHLLGLRLHATTEARVLRGWAPIWYAFANAISHSR